MLLDMLLNGKEADIEKKLLSELTADEDILFYWSMNIGLLPKLMMEWAC